ncbi:MAG: HAMP domain-containing histidine kinase [Candidatus Eremiobacteraeota bacterium]|nr:HAMP domain-containing histidine kinase [Candidatus Eremiobacteraeota bacterium]
MDGQSAIMTSLLHKLILLEAWESGTPAEHDVIDVAEAVERVVAPIADSHRHRDVRLDLAPNAYAAIDPDELLHGLGHLVTNALKYAPNGPITVQVAATTTHVNVSVIDEGPGMTDDELRHAFDRFYRGTRRDVPGSGLGLAIAKRAVERANGTLTVESILSQGTRFTIALPIARRSETVPTNPAVVSSP